METAAAQVVRGQNQFVVRFSDKVPGPMNKTGLVHRIYDSPYPSCKAKHHQRAPAGNIGSVSRPPARTPGSPYLPFLVCIRIASRKSHGKRKNILRASGHMRVTGVFIPLG